MEYRNLGRTGVRVAPLALGTDNILNPTPEAEARKMILRALEAGINLIDTSNSYMQGEAERVIGLTLKESGLRDQVLIATKAHYPTGPGPNDRGNSRLHLMRACEDSLRRLQTDYIDLYQLHRPVFDMPIDETLSALTDLVRQGKVRYIGSSTAPAWKVLEGILVSELKGYVRFVSEQPPYNLLDRRIENELVPMAQAYNLAILPWSPLAMGMLAGRYADEELRPEGSRASLRGGIYAERVSPRAVQMGNRFVKLAREAGYDPAQLAILWVKDQPGITAPIIGPKSLEQLQHLLPVLDMTLPEDIRAACDRLVPPGSAVANFHNSAPWMKMQLEVG
ncbi:aldo/keto reductase [Meiothermus hypogaeus]|uniref:Aldo/keto reductase n=2 Tax=Meiothermus hypogaeus TaxID=884155 RepID=A0A511R028_9DEIN|nr:aldo/keto reductase [Meiothermus hypogaeus]RIH77203.1 General stress protein 69 [Meiothermus hypogaeus]GEM82336.1 aldo/keto reductase [Meiothermus hypogaeus NBRC 106114]